MAMLNSLKLRGFTGSTVRFGKSDSLYNVKKMFFDRPKVINSLDKASKKSLGLFAGATRLTARRSIKKPAKKDRVYYRNVKGKTVAYLATSKPGDPPFNKTGKLKKFIYYGWDYITKTVVVGPVKLPIKGQAPHVLEYGGTSTARQITGFGMKGRPKRKEKRVRVAARPFMWPAAQKNMSKLPAIWRNSVH